MSINVSFSSQTSFNASYNTQSQTPSGSQQQKTEAEYSRSKSTEASYDSDTGMVTYSKSKKTKASVETKEAQAPQEHPGQSPEKTAVNILRHVTRSVEMMIEKGASEEEVQSRLDAAREGIAKGFADAKDMIEGMGKLTVELEAQIDKSFELVVEGLGQLEEGQVPDILEDYAPDQPAPTEGPDVPPPVDPGQAPVEDAPVAGVPVPDETVDGAPISDSAVTDEVIQDEDVVDAGIIEDIVVDDGAEEGVSDETVADEIIVDEVVVDDPAADEVISDEQTLEELIIDELVPETPDASIPAEEVPVYDKPVPVNDVPTPDYTDEGSLVTPAPVTVEASRNRESSFSLEVVTADGDKVSVTFNRSASGSLYYNSESGDLSLSSSRNSEWSLEVEGELDEGEMEALNQLLADATDISNSFFAGDLGEALSEAMNMGYDKKELASFSLELKQRSLSSVSRAYGSVAPSVPQPLQPVTSQLASYTEKYMSALEKAGQLKEPDTVFDQIMAKLMPEERQYLGLQGLNEGLRNFRA